MKALDRIIFIIVGLFFIALAAGCALVAIDMVSVDEILNFIKSSDIHSTIGLVVLAAEVVLFLFIGLRILFVRPKKQKITACTIMKSEEGEACVSVTAVENTVRLAMATFDDVKESRIFIRPTQNGINISARISVPTGIVIPELVSAVRTYLKSFTEEHTGVVVNNIKLVATEYKQVDPAVEKKKIAAEKKLEEKRQLDEKKAEEKRAIEEKKAAERQQAEEKRALELEEKKAEAQTKPTMTHARLFVVAEQDEEVKEESVKTDNVTEDNVTE